MDDRTPGKTVNRQIARVKTVVAVRTYPGFGPNVLYLIFHSLVSMQSQIVLSCNPSSREQLFQHNRLYC